MKKKWNISILVIFVLLACSLFGLLTVHYVRHMFVQYTQVLSYYKSYYLAKAGIELSLSQIQHRWIWFSSSLGPKDSLVYQNFSSSWLYYFDSLIIWKSSLLSSDFSQKTWCFHPFVLSSWMSLIVPLFFDNFSWSVYESFTTLPVYTNKWSFLEQISLQNNNNPWLISFGILVASWAELYPSGMFFMTGVMEGETFFSDLDKKIVSVFSSLEDRDLMDWKAHLWFQNYLIFANTSSHEISFCLQLPSDEKLPMQEYVIRSTGVFGNQKLSLEAVYKQPLPSFAVDSFLQ